MTEELFHGTIIHSSMFFEKLKIQSDIESFFIFIREFILTSFGSSKIGRYKLGFVERLCRSENFDFSLKILYDVLAKFSDKIDQ